MVMKRTSRSECFGSGIVAASVIAKHGARLDERDPVLPAVADLLLGVPFEDHLSRYAGRP